MELWFLLEHRLWGSGRASEVDGLLCAAPGGGLDSAAAGTEAIPRGGGPGLAAATDLVGGSICRRIRAPGNQPQRSAPSPTPVRGPMLYLQQKGCLQ